MDFGGWTVRGWHGPISMVGMMCWLQGYEMVPICRPHGTYMAPMWHMTLHIIKWCLCDKWYGTCTACGRGGNAPSHKGSCISCSFIGTVKWTCFSHSMVMWECLFLCQGNSHSHMRELWQKNVRSQMGTHISRNGHSHSRSDLTTWESDHPNGKRRESKKWGFHQIIDCWKEGFKIFHWCQYWNHPK